MTTASALTAARRIAGHLLLAAGADDDVRNAGQVPAALMDQVAQRLAARVDDAIETVDRDELGADGLPRARRAERPGSFGSAISRSSKRTGADVGGADLQAEHLAR